MEKEKIYLVTLESNIDGELYYSSIPCKTLEVAKAFLKEERDYVMNESLHFSNLTQEELDECDITDEETHFQILDMGDDYWEDYNIVETFIRTSLDDE